MASEWEEISLGEAASEVTVGYVGPMAAAYVPDGIPFFRSLNIEPYRFNTNDLKFITEEFHRKIKKSTLRPGDVVIVRTGKPGTCAVVPPFIEEANCSDLVIVRPSVKLDPYYLCYYINSHAQRYVAAYSVGAVQQHFNVASAKTIRLKLPSIGSQYEIAKILRVFDDQIELSRQMNKTLERMAHALFKSWFVDFDPVKAKAAGSTTEGMDDEIESLFPSEFEERELETVPKGWRAVSLNQLFDVIGGGTPKTTNPDFWNGEVPWFSLADAPPESDVFVIDTEKKITRLGLTGSSARMLRKGVTIISARGTVGKLAVVATPMAMNQSCYALDGKYGDFFTYYSAREAVTTLKQNTHGAVFDTITRDTFKTAAAVLPPPSLCQAFEDRVSPLMQRIEANLRQARLLKEIRDSLLPKLISGQLRIPDVEASGNF